MPAWFLFANVRLSVVSEVSFGPVSNWCATPGESTEVCVRTAVGLKSGWKST